MSKKIVSIQILIIYIFSILTMSFAGISNAQDKEVIGKEGYISSAVVLETITGTGPFDSNDEPGNDTSEKNDIVRSFDQVTYTVETTMRLKPTSTSTGLTGGKIMVEATLPEHCAGVMTWDKEAMSWVEDIVISKDRRTLTGYYNLNENQVTIPRKQSLNFVVKVEGAQNGLEFTPTFKTWIEGNEENEKVNIQGTKVRVSAAPKYNLALRRNSVLSQKETVKYNGENITGRMYGYGVGIQLYNDTASKGLKGIEYPTRRYYI